MNRRTVGTFILAGAVALTCSAGSGGCGGSSGSAHGPGGGGGGAGGGGDQNGTLTCTEKVPDPFGNASGITVEGPKGQRRVYARMNISCVGNLVPQSYTFVMLLVKDGNYDAPGNKVETAPVGTTKTVTVSRACEPGMFLIWFAVGGKFPDGSPLKGGASAQPNPEPMPPARQVRAGDC